MKSVLFKSRTLILILFDLSCFIVINAFYTLGILIDDTLDLHDPARFLTNIIILLILVFSFKVTVTPPAYDGKLTAITSGITVDRTGDKVKVTGVTEMLDASTVAAMFDGDCRITKADGSALTNGYVGSGCVINLYFGEKIYDSAVIIVKADIDGDGIVTGKDVIRAKKVMSDISVDGYREAGDINGDGVITDTDISFIASSCIK